MVIEVALVKAVIRCQTPSVLFLITMTFTFSLYFTSVASSPMSIVSPPSPTMHTTCRSGYATAAPML